MGSRDLPEGLEEMAKRDEPLDRRELDETYEELVDEVEDTELSRRTVLSAFAGGGGLAVLNALVAQKKFFGDDFESGLKAVRDASDGPTGVVEVESPTYAVDDDVYERHSGLTDFDFYPDVFRWIDEVGGTPAAEDALLEAGLETAGTSYRKPLPYNDPREGESQGLVRAHQALDYALGSLNHVFQPHSFARTDDRLDVQKHVAEGSGFAAPHLVERDPDVEDPERLRAMLRPVARLAGAGDVGVAEFDERWIYTHRGDGAPIVFEDVETPVLNDEKTVIPERFDRTVVGVSEMARPLMRTSPTHLASGAAAMAYGRMGIEATIVATWIRAMGYDAIPSRNDMGPSVPTAIDAGLGEGGRHGRLIHPQFGGNIRIWKVYTDMPLPVDPYVKFGVSEFCVTCRICVNNCPSNALVSRPYKSWKYTGSAPDSWEEATDAPWDATKANGVKKWYQHPKRCLRFWTENGTSCSNCVVACPFTHGRRWLEEVLQFYSPRKTGDTGKQTGYGNADWLEQVELRDPERIWDEDFLPFGLTQDAGLDRSTDRTDGSTGR
jgi:reductive dehalogenase